MLGTGENAIFGLEQSSMHLLLPKSKHFHIEGYEVTIGPAVGAQGCSLPE